MRMPVGNELIEIGRKSLLITGNRVATLACDDVSKKHAYLYCIDTYSLQLI